MTFFAKNFMSFENWGEILEKKEMRNCVAVVGSIRNHYPHTSQSLTCHRRHNRHSPSSKWACKKKLAREFSLPPFLLSPKIKNFRGPHCLVELSSEPKRKSNSPIVVILKIRLRIIVRANAR